MTLNETIARKIHAVQSLPAPDVCRQRRILAGLSQSDVAMATSVTPSAVARWEAGTRRPKGHRLLAYAELIGALSESIAL